MRGHTKEAEVGTKVSRKVHRAWSYGQKRQDSQTPTHNYTEKHLNIALRCLFITHILSLPCHLKNLRPCMCYFRQESNLRSPHLKAHLTLPYSNIYLPTPLPLPNPQPRHSPPDSHSPSNFDNHKPHKIPTDPIATMRPQHCQILYLKRPATIPKIEIDLSIIIQCKRALLSDFLTREIMGFELDI